MLQVHSAVVWFDASVRVKSSNVLSQLESTIRRSGIALVDFTGHSSFATTDKRMYNFLHTDMDLVKKKMLGANFIAIINSKELFRNVIEWWVRCSIERDCIAPLGSTLRCSFTDRMLSFAGCHRYDQSALNVLLVNHFKGDLNMYYPTRTCVDIEREVTYHFQLQICRL